MSTSITNNRFLLGSVALNIFLLAFILGRLSCEPRMLPFGPPPPWERNGAQGFMHGGHGDDRGNDHGRDERAGNDRERPPLFGPDDLFSKEEREANLAAVGPLFDKAQSLRESFAKHLKDKPVTKEEVVKHFESVDKIMEQLIRTMQERAAEKLAKLPEEERVKFAEHLIEMRMPPRDGIGVPGLVTPGSMHPDNGDHGGPDHDGPDGDRFHGPRFGDGPDGGPQPDQDKPSQDKPSQDKSN